MTAGSRKPLQSVALYRRRVASETTPEPELSCDVPREAAKTSAEAFKKRGRPPKTASRVRTEASRPPLTPSIRDIRILSRIARAQGPIRLRSVELFGPLQVSNI